jgi:hypothetical protein
MVEQKQNKTFWEEWHEYNDKDKSDFPLDYRTWLERKVESECSRHEEERRKWMDELLDVKEKYADECSRHEKELRETKDKILGIIAGNECANLCPLLDEQHSRHEKELKKYRDAIIVLYGSEGIMLFEKMSLKDWIREMTIGYKSVKHVFWEKKY